MNTCEKLENPVWFVMTGKQQEFACDFVGMKFYKPEFCPLGAFNAN
ncbi:MAG: hypothetical protein IPM34_14205 [Saprospiraceae bacterium]|nr:hypothetical protein [Saprospiraceae bacterium]